MAPRRPEASEPGKQAEASEPAREEQVGGADRESVASSAAALPGPVAEGAEGAEEVQERPEDAKERRRIRRALRSQAAGSGCTDKLEETLAELKTASAQRQEAQEEGRRDLEALQGELARLQSAERQHLRISELLVLSSRDRSSVRAEACSMAEQSTMLLVEELQRGLSEAESISRSVAEEVRRGKLSRSEEEVQQREELGALRSQLLEEEEEAARRRFREEAAHDEVAALTAELESALEREAAAAEECRLSSERAAEESREQPFTPKMKHTAPKEATADEDIAEAAPAWREGPPKAIGTVAELVASLFGSTDRPVRAEDLALLSTSALASLRLPPELVASPKGADGPLCCNLYDESDSELETATGNMELDRTMEWFMGTEDAGSSWQACDGSAVDGQPVGAPSSHSSLGEQLLSEAGEEDEDLEWDADAESWTNADAVAVGELMADLAVLLGLEEATSSAHPGWTGPDDASTPGRGADASVVVDGADDNGPGLEEHQPPTCTAAAPESSLEALPKEQETKPKEKPPREKLPTEKPPPKEKQPKEELFEEKLPEETLPVEEQPKEKPPREDPPQETLPEESLPVETLPEEKLPEEKLPEQTLPEQTHSVADLKNVDAATKASGDAAAQEPASDGGAPQHAGEEEPFKVKEPSSFKIKEPAMKSTVDSPETEENCTASQSTEAAVPAAQAEGLPAADKPAIKELDTPVTEENCVDSRALPDPPVAEASPPPEAEAPAEPALPQDARLWQVVGGADFGGIRAREGQAMSSEFLPDRLATGALVMELELNGERLHYSKIRGDGPVRGWVTVRIPGKELLVRVPHPAEEEEEAETERSREASREAIKAEFEAYQQQCARHPLKEEWLQALQERRDRMEVPLKALILQKAPLDLVDGRGTTALSKAVARKDDKVVRVLLTYSARPEWPPQKSALELVAKMPTIGGNKELVEMFKPARLRELRREEMQVQAAKGKSGEVALQVLLAAKARLSTPEQQQEWEEDLNSLDQGGMTVLHRCLFTNASLRVVGALLEARADVEALDKNGETPLFLAVRQAKGALLCSFLLDARAQLLQPNPKGQTVLDLASCCPGAAGEELLSALLNYATQEWWTEFEALAKEEPSRLILPPPVKAKPPRVSVICPTLPSRGRFHRQLWTSFTCQSYPDKELVVVDTGPEPSVFFSSEPVASDKRLVYKWHKDEDKFDPKNPEAGHGAHSIGSKRNIAVRAASGSIIAHFDDDDFYGPGYLDQMVALLLRHGAHAVKLSSFFVFECSTGRTGYCDHELDRLNVDDTAPDEFIFGYGFSYVYQRRVALKWGFPNVTMCEDIDFMMKLRKEGCSVCLWPDLDGICLHVLHGRNTSSVLSAESVPRCVVETSMDVAGCETLAEQLAKCPETAADDPNSVIKATPGTMRCSSLLGLSREIMDKRFRLRACKAVGPLGQAVLEARGLPEHRVLDAASPAAQIDRELRLDIVFESRLSVPCLVPWSATVGEAKSIAVKHLGLRHPANRLMLRDAEQALQDEQLLLGRGFLQLSFK